mgnify:FL=1
MRILYTLFCVAISMIGYTIHGSLIWAILNFIFAPIALIKWLIYHEITLNIIKETFSWFFV